MLTPSASISPHTILPLHPLLDEHLDDNFAKLLPHVFMGDVARWFVKEGNSHNASPWVARLVELLDRALVAGSADVRELVQVSFVENLPTTSPGSPALTRLTPALKADYARFSGIHVNGG